MQKLVGISLIFLFGCSAQWVYAPAPNEPIAMENASIAGGVLEPQNFYFTLISHYQPTQKARVVIMTEPAIKLADLTVSKQQIYVHARAPQVPGSLIRAWGQLVRERFLVPCPDRKIIQKAADLRGTFTMEVTGGICQ